MADVGSVMYASSVAGLCLCIHKVQGATVAHRTTRPLSIRKKCNLYGSKVWYRPPDACCSNDVR